MSFFGEIDTEEIEAGNLATGTYLFELTTIAQVNKEVDGEKKNWLTFTWSVIDEESESFGEEFQQWFTIFPDLSQEDFNDLPPKEKLKVKRHIGFLKTQLKNIGLPPEKMADFDIDSLKEDRLGTEAYIDVVVQPPTEEGKRPFIKPKKITLKDNIDTAANGTSDIDF